MDIEQATRIIAAIASLVQALIWPAIILFILIYFGSQLKAFLRDVGEFRFKGAGLEATVKRQQIQAAVMLGAATATRAALTADEKGGLDEDNARAITSVVSQVMNPRELGRLADATVLWVDDNPENNLYERRSLEAIGIRCTLSRSTEDALERMRLHRYDAIISDMRRPPDDRAGYTLLEEKTKQGDMAPFIIYAGSNRPEHKAEALRRGAVGSTNNPRELFQLVVDAIRSR